MSEVLEVKKRTQTGSRACRRLRREGLIPATIYGHGEEAVSLTVPSAQLTAAIRHGARLIDVQGDIKDSALIRDVQWDAMGLEVLHLDLTRVSADETVDINVAVDFRGIAPGTSEGGVVENLTHELQISCPARSIPDKLTVSINDLHLGQSILSKDVELPEGATLLSDPERVVVTCSEPTAEADEDEVAAALPGEPEVIGKKEEEGDD